MTVSPSIPVCTRPPVKLGVFLNIILPGSGLILSRNTRAGISAVCIFTICGHILIFGLLIVPLRISPTAVQFAAVVGAVTWLGAQILLWRGIRAHAGPQRQAQLQTCYDLADDACRGERPQDALGALEVALTVDDENPHTYARVARLNAEMGRYKDARKAWQRVRRFDRRREYAAETQQALARPSEPQSDHEQHSSGVA